MWTGEGCTDKSEDEIEQKKLISYVEAYYELTMAYEYKGTMQLRHDLNKQKSNRQTSCHEDSFIRTFSDHKNCLASTIVCNYGRNKRDKQ